MSGPSGFNSQGSGGDMYANVGSIHVKHTTGHVLLFEILIPLLVATFAIYAVRPSAAISPNTARMFFARYVKEAPLAAQRPTIYHSDFTSGFRRIVSRQDYNDYWRPIDYATLEGFVVQGTGNPLEFTVKILFSPVTGEPYSRTIDYYLACVGVIGSFIARLRTCPPSDIRIDSDNVG